MNKLRFVILPLIILLSAVIIASACGKKEAGYKCVWQGADRPEQLETIGCPDDHAALAAEPKASALPANKSTMFLIERQNGNKIHFFDSIKWRHYGFVQEEITGYPDFSAFNSEMYYRPDRRLYLGTVTRYLAQDIYAVEIAAIDKASPQMIEEIYQTVKKAFLFNADIRYHPTSNALEMETRLPANVPIIYTKDLYAGAKYQGMNLGATIGKLSFIKLDDLAASYIGRMDIALFDKEPNDVPVCAGIITAEFQTPLSHVNLLSQNRGTPNMALIGAFEDKTLRSFEGKYVKLTVKSDGYEIAESSYDEADAFWAAKRPSQEQKPALDDSVTGILSADDIDISAIPFAGGKAAHYGELRKIGGDTPVEKAFVIPVYYYLSFLKENKLDEDISAMLADPLFKEDGNYRVSALSAFRKKIKNSALNKDFADAVKAVIAAEYDAAAPIRFRSSSNAEDIEQFNGAGLYESKSYKPGDPDKTVEAAILGVYSSLWTLVAVEEREWARVDHFSCAMAILMHRSYPDADEKANGVAITANPFDPPPEGQAAYFVNVQNGAVSITNPEASVTPESFLYYKPPAGQGEMTYLSYSSLMNGETVLSFTEAVTLVRALQGIHEHFHKIYRDEPFGMDVEFKFIEEERRLIIKQARPYPFHQ